MFKLKKTTTQQQITLHVLDELWMTGELLVGEIVGRDVGHLVRLRVAIEEEGPASGGRVDDGRVGAREDRLEAEALVADVSALGLGRLAHAAYGAHVGACKAALVARHHNVIAIEYDSHTRLRRLRIARVLGILHELAYEVRRRRVQVAAEVAQTATHGGASVLLARVSRAYALDTGARLGLARQSRRLRVLISAIYISFKSILKNVIR